MPDMTEPVVVAQHCLRAGLTVDRFCAAMATRGWLVIDRFVDDDLVCRMRADLDRAYATCRRLQVANGIALDTEGTLHHLVGQGESFLEFIDRLAPIVPHLETHFGGPFILNSFGGNILRASPSYASANRPSDQAFAARAEAATGRAGSLLVFDSNLWHAAGVNNTAAARRSVTPMFSRPLVKPQFDHPRALGYERMDTLSELQRQVLGYYSRIPATLEEWYQPPQRRMYRPGQG